MQIVENVALISINATFFVQLGSFLLFMVIFNRLMVRPLRRVMAEREGYLQQVVSEIADAKRTYDELGRQIRHQEALARQEAHEQREKILESGDVMAAEIIEKTRLEINRLRTEAQKKAAAQITAFRGEIEREAAVLADAMIATVLAGGADFEKRIN